MSPCLNYLVVKNMLEYVGTLVQVSQWKFNGEVKAIGGLNINKDCRWLKNQKKWFNCLKFF